MIINGINTFLKYGMIWPQERKIKSPLPITKTLSVPGRSGELVLDTGALDDAEVTYTVWMPVQDKYDRGYKVSLVSSDLFTGKKVEIIDPRDNGFCMRGIITKFDHRPVGLSPMYEEFTMTFQVDPYMLSKTTKTVPVNAYIENNSDIAVPYIMDLEVGYRVNGIDITAPQRSLRFNLTGIHEVGNSITIDTEKRLITKNGQIAQHLLALTDDFFLLPPGENNIYANGCTGTITFRERRLIG